MKTRITTFGNDTVWTNIPRDVMSVGSFKPGKGFSVRKVSHKSIDLTKTRKTGADYFVHTDGRAKLPLSTWFEFDTNSIDIAVKAIDNGVRITVG
jgi:hypothetical protein